MKVGLLLQRLSPFSRSWQNGLLEGAASQQRPIMHLTLHKLSSPHCPCHSLHCPPAVAPRTVHQPTPPPPWTPPPTGDRGRGAPVRAVLPGPAARGGDPGVPHAGGTGRRPRVLRQVQGQELQVGGAAADRWQQTDGSSRWQQTDASRRGAAALCCTLRVLWCEARCTCCGKLFPAGRLAGCGAAAAYSMQFAACLLRACRWHGLRLDAVSPEPPPCLPASRPPRPPHTLCASLSSRTPSPLWPPPAGAAAG